MNPVDSRQDEELLPRAAGCFSGCFLALIFPFSTSDDQSRVSAQEQISTTLPCARDQDHALTATARDVTARRKNRGYVNSNAAILIRWG